MKQLQCRPGTAVWSRALLGAQFSPHYKSVQSSGARAPHHCSARRCACRSLDVQANQEALGTTHTSHLHSLFSIPQQQEVLVHFTDKETEAQGPMAR